MQMTSTPATTARGHRVRELVCTYRSLRDGYGQVVGVPTLALTEPRIAAATLAPLIGDQGIFQTAVVQADRLRRFLKQVDDGSAAEAKSPGINHQICARPAVE